MVTPRVRTFSLTSLSLHILLTPEHELCAISSYSLYNALYIHPSLSNILVTPECSLLSNYFQNSTNYSYATSQVSTFLSKCNNKHANGLIEFLVYYNVFNILKSFLLFSGLFRLWFSEVRDDDDVWVQPLRPLSCTPGNIATQPGCNHIYMQPP